jgi:hypothetical protein
MLSRKHRGVDVPASVAAAALVALPYAHYALSRAGESHLARGGMPMFIGLLLVTAGTPRLLRWLITGALLAGATIVLGSRSPAWECFRNRYCQPVPARGATIWVNPWYAEQVRFVVAANARFAPGDAPVLVLPYLPGAYPLLGKPSPLKDTYPLWVAKPQEETADIARLDQVRPTLVLFADAALDGDPARSFRFTHPLTYRYLGTHYVRTRYHFRESIWVLVRRAAPTPPAPQVGP